ncbi:unnamed protein product [Linum tenue]|uniref:Uncharacterized protein n=1 Tax=Linum tenue TaxID=586396 RepID=A0AAV0NW47_9ROSI|nr:unnamed protein product [Linum tenue]CAI0462559.1 unnamed protein product [Linum tenue]
MVDEQGLQFSPRKATVSAGGLVPELERFLHESNSALAVSLNATTDEVRNCIMPTASIISACFSTHCIRSFNSRTSTKCCCWSM